MLWFGDNGIISTAMDANQKNGMAILEEYLQEKYVENYEESDNYMNKPELLASKMSGLFLKQGNKNYITSSLSGNGVQQYYLINKSALPEEIRNELAGGDTTDFSEYVNFIDVYGVTEELKVYYCKDGLIDGVLGEASGVEIDMNTPLTKVNNDKKIADAVKEALGLSDDESVKVRDVMSLKRLTLNDSSITDISALSEAYVLENLTLENLTLTNLSGIENCSLLKRLYLKGTQVGNYSALCSNTKLEELYVSLNLSWSEDICNSEIENLSLGLQNANNLENLIKFGIAGTSTIFNEPDSLSQHKYIDEGTHFACYMYDEGVASKLSNVSSLSKLNSSIKNSIKYIYLNNNNIASISALSDFKNLNVVAIMNNKSLNNLSGLENHTSLLHLFGWSCCEKDEESEEVSGLSDVSALGSCTSLKNIYIEKNLNLTSLGDLKNLKSLKNLWAFSCNITNISGLSGLTQLDYLSLYSNVNLVEISTLGTLTGLHSLYLANNINMSSSQIAPALDATGIRTQCGVNFSIPDIFEQYFEGCGVDYRDLADSGLTNDSAIITKFKTRNDVTNVKILDLGGNSNLSDDTLQTILKRMKNLEILSLRGCSNLASLDFISNGNVTKLTELDLRDTNITDLSNLETYGTYLHTLILNNYSTQFSKIQTTISSYLGREPTRNSSSNTLHAGTTMEQQFGGLILTGDASRYSFAGCTNIVNMYMWSYDLRGQQSGTLDLTGLSGLRTFSMRRIGMSVNLPSGLTTFYRTSSLSPACYFHEDTQLQYLSWDMGGNTIFLDGFSKLKKCPVELDLRRGGPATLEFLNAVIDSKTGAKRDASTLTTLKVGYVGNDLPGGITSLSGIEKASNLITLWVGRADNLPSITELCKATSLLNLSIYNRQNSSVTTVYLSTKINNVTYTLSNLQDLHIYTNTSITKIDGLDKISSLQTLYISDTGISDLTGLSNQTNLTSLTLNSNQISDLSELDTLIENCGGTVGFTSLNLSSNSIDYYGGSGNDNVQTILNLIQAGVTSIDIRNNTFAKSNKFSNVSGVRVN